MEKIYSIRNGNIVFYILVFLCLLSGITCIIFIPRIEAVYLLLCFFLLFCSSAIFYNKQYLNYVIIDDNGIRSKKRVILWENLFITVDHDEPNLGRNAFVYQFYFCDKFLDTKMERKECRKNGFFIDINKKRLKLILRYYKNDFLIVRKSPMQQDILCAIEKHNLNKQEQK